MVRPLTVSSEMITLPTPLHPGLDHVPTDLFARATDPNLLTVARAGTVAAALHEQDSGRLRATIGGLMCRVAALEEDNAALQLYRHDTEDEIDYWRTVASCLTKDNDELAEKVDRLTKRIHTDAKTGMLSEQGFAEDISKLDPANGRIFLSFIDVKDFKLVNDTLGHAIGDKILQTIAVSLIFYCRHEDLLAIRSQSGPLPYHVSRPHGDEFVNAFQVPHDSGYSSVEIQDIMTARMHGIRDLVVEHVPELVKIPTFHISVGMAEYDPELGYEAALKDADRAMYQDKDHQRKRYGHVGRDQGGGKFNPNQFVPPSHSRKTARISRRFKGAAGSSAHRAR
ncbi:MAG: GGDEF domain-containing protein [Candidatus Saccharimonadales bacterium]